MVESERRLMFMAWLIGQKGKPYVWSYKGAPLLCGEELLECYDCSGLITAGLNYLGCPDWRQTHSAAKLFDELEATKDPHPGDLAFYGPPTRITHTMIFWGDGRVFGATGGNRDTTTPVIAKKKGACVQFKPSVNYRPDFRGFRKLPIP